MKMFLIAALFSGALASSAVSQAATSAYWRHEEGVIGGAFITVGPDAVIDSSGNGNHMRTFDPGFTSATYAAAVSPLALTSGLPNTLSLDFGPGGDDAGLNDDNYSEGKAINSQMFSAMTVELAYRMDTVAGFQALFGKDGKPTASPVPPFKVLIRGDDFPDAIPNQLFIEWIDGDGDVHFLASGQTVTAGNWNHVAFTLTPTDAELWVASETSPYTKLDEITGGDFAGAAGEVLFNSTANYTIGRGMFNGGIGDWSDALIDEVRVSDTALAPGAFLFVAVPEPATWAVMAVGALAVCRLRRRAVA